MWVIVGLGNPGKEYTKTRHNLGFRCIDLLSRKLNVPLTERKKLCVVGTGHALGHQLVLAKPRTYVNNSGEGVRYLRDRFGNTASELLVIYDDVDLPAGRVRLRPGGSPGGHNGMKSITGALGTQAFPRLRIGIGKPPDGVDYASYVLSAFTLEEAKVIDEAIKKAAEAISVALGTGLEQAMNRFN